MWTRSNTFETLIHIILEQQVSLASTLAALNKLREKIGKVTPGKILTLTDEELKATSAVRNIVRKIIGRSDSVQADQLESFGEDKPDEEVRTDIVALNDWETVGADVVPDVCAPASGYISYWRSCCR